MEVAVATLPVLFLFVIGAVRIRPARRSLIAGTLLGVFWIGLAFAHAVLLRQLPHGNGILIDVLVGTFLGDTAAYIGGRLFGRRPLAPQISPNKTVEGLFCGMLIAVLAVFFAACTRPGCTRATRCCSGSPSPCSARSATCSSRSSSATPGRRTRARCSERTAARSTASTR